MIFGIGVDLVYIKRFESWIEDSGKLRRFFNKDEIKENCSKDILLEHYASRFAAKEAFSKALGTGIYNFNLKDICVVKNNDCKPELKLEDTALCAFNERCKDCIIHLSLTHEKDYAMAYVIIEKVDKIGG